MPTPMLQPVKIVATLGPASSARGTLRELLRAGVAVVRLNLSHGSHEEHRAQIALVRELEAEQGRPVAILLDLQGPKIRTGALAGGQPVRLVAGQTFQITTREHAGDARRVSTDHAALPGDTKPGDRILVSDGRIELRVTGVRADEVETVVVQGGLLAERQGMNLPGMAVSAPALTGKDLRDLAFGVAQGVDCVALSFVRRPEDLRAARRELAALGSDLPVIAKLEKPEAIANLEAIAEVADGLMVARGDLGVELGPEKVPLVQKRIIAVANALGRPVITATQMLESMIEQPRPTRAEASDVANAILDGSDALMLSGETAVGRHPLEAVRTIGRVAAEIHAHEPQRSERRHSFSLARVDSSPHAIAAAVAAVTRSLPGIAAIWVITRSGSSARLVSRERPGVPIVAFTPEAKTWRWLALLWGVTPVLCDLAHDEQALERAVRGAAARRGLAQPGQTIVLTGSHPFGASAETNFLKIERL